MMGSVSRVLLWSVVACLSFDIVHSVDVSITPLNIAARLGHNCNVTGNCNVSASDTSSITYKNIDPNLIYQVRFFDYVYNAPTNFGGLAFDQTVGHVTLACQPPAWSPARETFQVDGKVVGECTGGSSALLTTSYGINSTINITVSR